MKAKELLKQVLENGNTEQQGISIVGPFESRESFIERWFGEYVSSIGNIQNNKKYLFCYNKKELKDVADAIIKTKDDTIYLYLIKDEEENNTIMKRKQHTLTSEEQTRVEIAIFAQYKNAVDVYNEKLAKYGPDNGVTRLAKRKVNDWKELKDLAVKSEKLISIYYTSND